VHSVPNNIQIKDADTCFLFLVLRTLGIYLILDKNEIANYSRDMSKIAQKIQIALIYTLCSQSAS